MKEALLIPLSLAVAGLVAVGVGVAILFVPHAFYASSGIALGDNVNLLNEMRASGGPVLMVGLFALISLARTQWAAAALTASATLYLVYGLSRCVGLFIDGIPGDALLQVIGLEFAVGLLCLYALSSLRVEAKVKAA